MLDIDYFRTSKSDVQIFENPNQWMTWIKPRSAKMVNIFCMGGGSGGGAGAAVFYGGQGSGAGGGPATSIKAIFQATTLPDTLYVYVGKGGVGGTANGAVSSSGSPGNLSYVTAVPVTGSAVSTICVSALTVGTGGGVGGFTGGTTATSQTPITTTVSASFLNLAIFSSHTIPVAAGGVTNQNGANLTPGGYVGHGTAGGGVATSGTARDGGSILATIINPLIVGGVGTVALNTIGGRGNDGVIIYTPILTFTGGTGGGNARNVSSTTSIGGAGGNGAYGCGGGGGGGGYNYGGNGGNGGDGLVIITTTF